MKSEFAGVQAQVATLNAEMARMVGPKGGLNPTGWNNATKAVHAHSQAYRDAANSGGMWEVSQMRMASGADVYTKKLEKQKITFHDMMKDRGLAYKAAYREQLKYQNAVVTQLPGVDSRGNKMFDVAVPTEVHKSWDTLNNRVGFFRENMKSASIQMQNWGKNTQWAGRQLTMGLTMPIAAFGVAAGTMAFQVDKEMTRIRKVYDLTADATSSNIEDMKAVQAEYAALNTAAWNTVTMATNDYASAATDTLQVQAELAAQGKKGMELQEATAQVMRIATLGEFEAADATKTLTALQATMGYTAKQVGDQFNYMNSVENATSLATQDFAKAIPIALGPLKEMGGDVKDLGLLLVAMKERGIEAGEGANAIKSMMQRLYRPSKAIKEEWMQLASIDLTQMVDGANGNVMKILPQIANAVENLGRADRVQLLGGLFGTYQVARQNAILKGLDAANKGLGQTGAVLRLNESSWESYADTADREMKELSESASFQFTKALNEVKNELAEMGTGFLSIGTNALKVITWLIDAIQNMPDFAKTLAKWGIGLVAVAGPLTMFAGLAVNLIATMLRSGIAVSSLGSKYAFMTKEGHVSTMAQKLMEKGMLSAGQAANMQALALTQLAESMAVASAGAAGVAKNSIAASQALRGEAFNAEMVAKAHYATADALEKKGKASAASIADRRQRGAAAEVDGIVYHDMADRAKSDEKAVKAAGAVEGSTRKTRTHMAGAAVSGGLFSAAMVTSMIAGDGLVSDIANYAMLAAIIVPTMKTLVDVSRAWYVNNKLARQEAQLALATQKGSVAATAATGAAAAVTTGKFAKTRAVGRGLVSPIVKVAAGFARMLGPVGMITAAVVTIGAGLYFWNKKLNEIQEKQIASQKALSQATENWATSAGKVAREYKRIQGASALPEVPQSEFDKKVDAWKSDENKDLMDNVEGMGKEELDSFLVTQYIDLMNRVGLSAKDAALEIKAMLIAAEKGFGEADASAAFLFETIGALDFKDLQQALTESITQINWESDTTLADSAEDFAGAWSEAMVFAKTPEEVKSVLGEVEGLTKKSMENVNGLLSDYGKDKLKQAGIDSLSELEDAMANNQFDFMEWQQMTLPGLGYDDVKAMTEESLKFDAALAMAMAEVAQIDGTFANIEEVLSNIKIASMTWSMDKVKKETKEIYLNAMRTRIEMSKTPGKFQDPFFGGDDEATAAANERAGLEDLRAIAKNHNIKLSNDLFEQQKFILNNVRAGAADVTNEVGLAAQQAKLLKSNLEGVDFKSAYKGAMENVQSELGQIASENFSNQMSDAMDAYSEGQQGRVDALVESQENAADRLENRQDKATRSFEAGWERRRKAVEKAYDDRTKGLDRQIDAEQRAEDVRTRVFDAEITRIQRMNETANSTIDFNVALDRGELDEAAKIRNDMQAQSETWALEDADGKAARKSENTIKRLEKQKQTIEEIKDARLESLDKIEEKERRHLENVQKAQTEALQKRQEQAKEYLDKEVRNNIDAQQEIWDNRKRNVDKAIELFQAYVPRNEKELKAHIARIEGKYGDFNLTTRGKFNKTSVKIGGMLRDETARAAQSIRSDINWENIGATASKRMLKGALGMTWKQFEKWMTSGVFPSGVTGPTVTKSNPGGGGGTNGYDGAMGDKTSGPNAQTAEKRHEGGFVGSGGGSRKGVARTSKQHASEKMILARKGEFVVNRDMASKHSDTLEAINDGKTPRDTRGEGGGGFGGMLGAVMGGVVRQAIYSGIATANNRSTKKYNAAQEMSSTGAYYGQIGSYSLPGVKPWVLEAANYLGGKFGINSIGGVGSRPTNSTSDHPRGLALDFMTSDIAKGNALSSEAIKRWQDLDATYLIWRERIHSFDNRGWQPYNHPSGATDPTSLHYDHVHLSFDDTGDVGDLPKTTTGSSSARGDGRYWRASIPGKGWNGNSHDYDNDFHDPVFAIGPGTVQSWTMGPGEGGGQDAKAWPRGYGSWGVVSRLNLDDGNNLLYAHLWPGSQVSGRVQGGQQIAEAASTGNSSGSHTHFEINGSEAASSWFEQHGIGLKRGGVTKSDGIANLHKNEVVVDPKRTGNLFKSLDQFTEMMTMNGFSMMQIMNLFRDVKIKGDKGTGAKPNELGDATTSGEGTVIKTGTYNVFAGNGVGAMSSDLSKLMAQSDVLSLTEMHAHGAMRDFMNKQGWDMFAGNGTGRYGREAAVAWNNRKFAKEKTGTRQLGERTGNFVGGRGKRFANYALLRDRESDRKFWQVSAHTVPTVNSDAAHMSLFNEQYKHLDSLVGDLQDTGAPVFVGGDFNQHRGNKFWNTPGGLTSYRDKGIDHIFSDPNLVKFLGQQQINGLNTDHKGGGYLAQFQIPGLAKGAENIKWDNTLANLHKGESVLTEDISKKFKQGVANFASGGNSEYTINVNATTNADANDIAQTVLRTIRWEESRKPRIR